MPAKRPVRGIDDLIARLRCVTFDMELSTGSREMLCTGLELLKRRYLLFTGKDGPETLVGGYESPGLAASEGARHLQQDAYTARVIDALTGKDVWTEADFDRTAN